MEKFLITSVNSSTESEIIDDLFTDAPLLDNNVDKAKVDMEVELEAVLDRIDEQEEDAIMQSLEQEIIEVTNIYYKNMLGRDMSDIEIERWLQMARDNGSISIEQRIPAPASINGR